MKTRPIAAFCHNLGLLYGAFGVHKKGCHVECANIDMGLEKVSSVKDYLEDISHAVQQNLGKNTTNGPDGTISVKTMSSVAIVESCVRDLMRTIQNIDPNYVVDLQSCLTLQVESLHSIYHLKNTDLLHMLEHAKSYGTIIKESLKRVCSWSVYYYTSEISYYPVPQNQIQFADIPKLDLLPVVRMEKEEREALREWAKTYGKTVRQCNVRQETCSYKCGTLPLYAYEVVPQPGQTIDLAEPDEPASDSDSDAADGPDSEPSDQDSEYGSDSSDNYSLESDGAESDGDDDRDETGRLGAWHGEKADQNDALNFLPKTTKSGRTIKVNLKYM